MRMTVWSDVGKVMQPITGKVNSHMKRDKLRQCKDIHIIDWLIVIMWWHGFVSAYHIWLTVCVVRYQRCTNAINNTLNGTNKSRCHHHHHDCGLCDCDMIVVLLSCLCGFVFSCAFLLVVVVVVVVLFHMTARRCVCDDDWLCWRPWVCLATFQLSLSLSLPHALHHHHRHHHHHHDHPHLHYLHHRGSVRELIRRTHVWCDDSDCDCVCVCVWFLWVCRGLLVIFE